MFGTNTSRVEGLVKTKDFNDFKRVIKSMRKDLLDEGYSESEIRQIFSIWSCRYGGGL